MVRRYRTSSRSSASARRAGGRPAARRRRCARRPTDPLVLLHRGSFAWCREMTADQSGNGNEDRVGMERILGCNDYYIDSHSYFNFILILISIPIIYMYFSSPIPISICGNHMVKYRSMVNPPPPQVVRGGAVLTPLAFLRRRSFVW